MAQVPERRDEQATDFHPFIYKIAIGLVALFVVAAWAAFDRRGETGEESRHGHVPSVRCRDDFLRAVADVEAPADAAAAAEGVAQLPRLGRRLRRGVAKPRQGYGRRDQCAAADRGGRDRHGAAWCGVRYCQVHGDVAVAHPPRAAGEDELAVLVPLKQTSPPLCPETEASDGLSA